MATISALGVGSGILNSDLVDSLVSAERKPVETRLNAQVKETEALISAYGKLRSGVTELQAPMRALSSSDAMRSFAGTSSNPNVEITVDGGAASRGTYTVNVETLAKAHSLASAGPGYADKGATAVGTGELTLTTAGVTKTLTIDSGNNTLQGLADSINELNMGITAGVVDTGDGFRLVMSAEKSGTANAITVSATDLDPANTGLTSLAAGLEETIAAEDAVMTVNGIRVVRPSNTIEGVIEGVTFDLKGEGVTSTISITQDSASVADKVQEFVDKFNSLQDTIKQLSGYDSATQTGGVLNGDSTVRTIQNQLRGILGRVVPGLENAPIRSMADVGLATNWETGKLDFDRSKFLEKLEAHPDDMTALFAEQGRTSDPQVKFLRSGINTQPGDYAINVTQIATQGSISGNVITATAFDMGAGSTFSLEVDGTAADFTLSGAFATRAELLTHINGQLAANDGLRSAGKSVTAAFEGDQLVLKSGRFGAESTVNVTAADATIQASLGLNVGTGTMGVNVAGTINGKPALGNGQTLYSDALGTGPESGIQVRITGGATGDRGTVSFIEGVGDKIVGLVANLTESQGVLTKRPAGLRETLSDIADQRIRLDDRMASLRARLVAQFSAADSLISQLNSTQEYVTQQLAALAPQNSK
ncbi:flagellar filament capping protein FliD [Hydrocarboniclastica marina]|uniref:Flagellar hook-associated protein 2 n=1 Tax=Hydrocarboniclastica marina TaxID=2259620 RepID=A0A4P7XGG6_9ALTE|nr:flagellar filament capping protein FliD [Hydrocarboniclastica marina]MAL97126.1 flagellar cap protein FliD [Alteromonadaceae bacterium]QCF25534.1 flagellar cap protein FliD [Hydrocarboniclastica marina]|tara:strand:+ start:632 stop:2581 length:1950 start_codon:yes stop_codon:yes gene_type:complete